MRKPREVGPRSLRGFGRRLRYYRELRGLSQRDLAKRIDTTQPAIVHWERGLAYPQLGLAVRLSRVLKVKLWTLVTGQKYE